MCLCLILGLLNSFNLILSKIFTLLKTQNDKSRDIIPILIPPSLFLPIFRPLFKCHITPDSYGEEQPYSPFLFIILNWLNVLNTTCHSMTCLYIFHCLLQLEYKFHENTFIHCYIPSTMHRKNSIHICFMNFMHE